MLFKKIFASRFTECWSVIDNFRSILVMCLECRFLDTEVDGSNPTSVCYVF